MANFVSIMVGSSYVSYIQFKDKIEWKKAWNRTDDHYHGLIQNWISPLSTRYLASRDTKDFLITKIGNTGTWYTLRDEILIIKIQMCTKLLGHRSTTRSQHCKQFIENWQKRLGFHIHQNTCGKVDQIPNGRIRVSVGPRDFQVPWHSELGVMHV